MTEKFAEFLTDLTTYHAAERYWRERFAALPCDPFANGWEDWGTSGVRVIADESCNIYGAVHRADNRGIVIVMCKPSEAIQQLTAWTATWGEGWQDTVPVDYLKINLVHTEQSESMALALLQRFVCESASIEDINALIGSLTTG
ncbi:hypothetical protein GCM10011487_22160 [Steroidobacter agaridevorans]|uniref:Uncharacterized protein n=1 Tax=Steroidobacter agaridevorans TaxID=2695856 RepID=A0A829YC31_9GAMM|nr:hypothetical protein [Steroidobacter agaridevorans]GFE80216.1 hypothetical protein GCM10011487_22160 [Steroidobacter agaridevorans]GFE89814.1 hypothetical protein GCM10011488_47680 [Steroidobacter agaridevorans]